jgi:hypothetical protein
MGLGIISVATRVPAALSFALVLGATAAHAADVVVKDNGTVLRSAPVGDAAPSWKVNEGFPLTVLEEQGDWLRVESAALPDGEPAVWVRADQVAADQPPADAELTAAAAGDEEVLGYRIELTGTPRMKFMLECRIEDGGHVLVDHRFNRLPRTYEYAGDAISCVLFKKQHNGGMQITLVELYPTKQRVIGSAASRNYPTSIFARSCGPWGVEAVVEARHNDLVLDPREVRRRKKTCDRF